MSSISSGDVCITVPNDLKFLPVVLNTISGMASVQSFNKSDISKIELGAEEALSNVIKHAFEPGEEASFDVILRPQSLGLKIIIKEKGIPFDPALIHKYDPEALSKELTDKGLGTFLMQQFIDEVSFVNLGKEGKETHLFKYLNDKPIDQTLNNAEFAQVEKEKNEEVLPKGSVNYDVRRMLPSEAIDVSKGAYSSYGYSYVLEHIYFPERVREMNEQNELISYVGVVDGGEVIAHCALEIEETDPLTPQLGVAFTKPKYRGQGCMNRLADACIGNAKERGLFGLYARGVTTHPYSQKSLLKFRLNDCSINISSGAARQYKGMEGHSQRESVVLHFRYMQEVQPIEIYPPENHREMIEKIYSNIDGHPVIKTNSGPLEYAQNESQIKVETDHVNNVGKIRVQTAGADLVPQVIKNQKALCFDRMETIYLYLKLNDPSTAMVTSEFEKAGFFFAGIFPMSGDNDVLILQFLNNHIIDYEKVKIASEFGNELLAYIQGCDPGTDE